MQGEWNDGKWVNREGDRDRRKEGKKERGMKENRSQGTQKYYDCNYTRDHKGRSTRRAT